MVSELIDKYVWLIQIFIDAGENGLPLERIERKWRDRYETDYPRRTFNNHREAISSIFGIEIECNRSTNCYFIRYGKDAIDQQSSIGWLINTFTVNNLLSLGNERLSGRVSVENIPSGQIHLTSIISAMQHNRILKIEYKKYVKNESDTFHIEPYALKEYQKRWYLIGYCQERGDQRVYALDRIVSLQTSDWTFSMPDDFDVDELYAQTIGIYLDRNAEAESVYIRVTEKEAKYLHDLPLHHSQVEHSRENGYVTFRLRVIPNEDLIMELKRHGSEIEVISPPSLRKRMADDLRKTLDLYNTGE